MPFPAVDLTQVQTFPVDRRPSLVALHDLIDSENGIPSFENPELADVARHILTARQAGRPVIWMIGAHVVKCGLSRFLIELMRSRVITHMASNGAATIHDFEIALIGNTSEDVATSLENGSFGMAEETGSMMNEAIRAGAKDGLGMGEALGQMIAEDDSFVYRKNSLLYTAYTFGIPYTVHVALGTDIIHQHPRCDFAALGSTSGQDFKIFTNSVTHLEGGVFCNFGSAVIGPEVFLKALSIARNLGYPLRVITTANFDLLSLSGDYHQPASKDNPEYYYRPKKNIVIRPTSLGGHGYHIHGDHRKTIPTLYHLIQNLEGDSKLTSFPVNREPLHLEWPDVIEELAKTAPRASLPFCMMMEEFPDLQASSKALVQAFNTLVECFQNGGTLFVCGNGGSFADAFHIAGELNKSFKLPRSMPPGHRANLERLSGGAELATYLQQGLRTIVLGSNPSFTIAVDNDNPQQHMAFAQELYVLARPGDVLLGISTGGEVKDVLLAALVAKARGLTILGLTGPRDSPIKAIADVTIQSPGEEPSEIQNWHLHLYHTLCEMLEQHFFAGTG